MARNIAKQLQAKKQEQEQHQYNVMNREKRSLEICCFLYFIRSEFNNIF